MRQRLKSRASGVPRHNDRLEDPLVTNLDNSPKRRKILVACEGCRSRKIRCDGEQPSCGPCAKRVQTSVKCIYNSVKRESEIILVQSIERLEHKIKVLENDKPHSCLSPVIATKIPALGHNASSDSGSEGTQESIQGNRTNHVPVSTKMNLSDIPLPTTENINEVDSTSTVENDLTDACAMGCSSAADFVKKIKELIDSRVDLTHQSALYETSDRTFPFSYPWTPDQCTQQKPGTDDFVLPSRTTADSLVNTYWAEVYVLCPLLHRPSFDQEYHKVWLGETSTDRGKTFHCMLNAVFALGSQLNSEMGPVQKESNSNIYFQRAIGLLRVDLLGSRSFHLVQILLLMGQYLQSTNAPRRCSVLVGLAIRIAQDLGLDLPETSLCLETQRDQEMARRIWHGCVIMDRVLSMTFGRIPTISQACATRVPLPAVIDDEYLSIDSVSLGQQPPGEPSKIAFFNAALQLSIILGDILTRIYDPVLAEDSKHLPSRTKPVSKRWDDIPIINSALTQWWHRLPEFLKVYSAEEVSDSNRIFLRQANAIRAQYLHLRTLLFRPVLRQFCNAQASTQDDGPSSGVVIPHYLALRCSILCVAASQQLVDLVYSNRNADGSSEVLPAWWNNILYVYTSAIVLIAARLCPSVIAVIGEPAVDLSWKRALDVLYGYHHFSEASQRCIAVLKILDKEIQSEKPELNSSAMAENS